MSGCYCVSKWCVQFHNLTSSTSILLSFRVVIFDGSETPQSERGGGRSSGVRRSICSSLGSRSAGAPLRPAGADVQRGVAVELGGGPLGADAASHLRRLPLGGQFGGKLLPLGRALLLWRGGGGLHPGALPGPPPAVLGIGTPPLLLLLQDHPCGEAGVETQALEARVRRGRPAARPAPPGKGHPHHQQPAPTWLPPAGPRQAWERTHTRKHTRGVAGSGAAAMTKAAVATGTPWPWRLSQDRLKIATTASTSAKGTFTSFPKAAGSLTPPPPPYQTIF